MIRETVSPIQQEVKRAREALRISQNAFARRCGVHPSILSRVLAGTMTSAPAERKIRVYLGRVRRRVVAHESAQERAS